MLGVINSHELLWLQRQKAASTNEQYYCKFPFAYCDSRHSTLLYTILFAIDLYFEPITFHCTLLLVTALIIIDRFLPGLIFLSCSLVLPTTAITSHCRLNCYLAVATASHDLPLLVSIFVLHSLPLSAVTGDSLQLLATVYICSLLFTIIYQAVCATRKCPHLFTAIDHSSAVLCTVCCNCLILYR